MLNLKKKFPSLSSLGGDGNTSFLRSARAGNLEKVLEHLKNNIDINTCNTNGLNALHLASKDGHVHVVFELLKRGALVDSATKKGNTALHIASLAGQEEVVKLLLQSSASVNVQSQNGFTPLYMAAQENHDSVVKLLLTNGANQSLATEDGFTPLAVAMQQGHDKVVAVLLESDTRGKVRLPALHIAAKKDDVKAANLLLENDHNPDITSKSGFTPLHIASHYGNQSIANLLIQKGADVNYLAKHNISPLHVAAKWGKTVMVSLLLEKGANIDAKTRDGLTPLHCAARSGHEQVVDMLLERGAPISAKTKNGLAPLHMAAQGEHVDAARILLYHRAPVDEVTVDYLTALHVAAHCGHVRVAKLLLDRNADANARALNGFTPLHIACKKNRIKVVELLLRHGASISATTESGLTPLHVASFMGCMNIVIYLLQHDASPDVPTVRGETPLHLAARANQTDIIRILLRNGAQVDARAREQQTPLHIASRLGNVDIVMLLLQHGSQVDATTKDMYTALHIAAKEGQDEVAAILIENGAALDSSTKKGFTPLHLAAKYGHMKVAYLLLQKNADVDAQGKNGVTPLHVACHYDKQNVALLLLERGASPHAPAKNGHTPLHIAAKKNQMDIATTLLEYGAHANTESKAGFTPLHLSSQEGHAEISSLLIDHKSNCNHAAKNGLTPMHLCAQEDNVNVAELIYKNGANIEITTKAGYTPLHVAAHFGQSNMVRFLLQKSSNVDASTAIGYTPLHQAAQQGHCHIVNLLLEHSANANAQTVNGQTPLHIAKKLGYISVLDSLKSITNEEDNELNDQCGDKYRVVAPEAMHETFMSDSEEEGGEDNALSDQPYRYLTVDEMKSLGDDSLPIDVTRDERMDSNRLTQSIENTPKPAVEEIISPNKEPENALARRSIDETNIFTKEVIHTGRKLQWKNFLVSFLVDARGGAMRGCRHSGVKIIIPSRSTCQPTRITCRYVKPQRTMHPPQLMEGEALASRVLELGPVSVKFQGPIVMEVPHYASLRGKEREIIILRSDNGETWREHTIENSGDITQDVLNECFEVDEINQLNEKTSGHVCRFVTFDFPQYFAVVSRIRQEVHAIGSEGGMVSSTVVPQVQAVFPQGALTKKIKVGLQAQPVDPDLTAKLLGRGVAVSPIVTVEPRRRKFHKAITLSMPAPKAHSQGMINQYSGNTPTLRLLCSITGGASRAQWEDVTGSTPLTFVNDCVSFTTTVSARFWLMDCRNISEATKMATELYREVIHVPFMARFVVYAKRVETNEAKLRVFCVTDDKENKTLENQEQFTEVAKSRDVEVLEGKYQYVEMAGNLVPVKKTGEQLQLVFKAFRENRLPFIVRVKDQHADIVGRTLFMKEPKIAKGEPPQHPICILNIILPEIISLDQSLNNYAKETQDYNNKYNSIQYIEDIRVADISNLLGKDFKNLATEIGITQSEINTIEKRFPKSIARQAQDMFRIFQEKGHCSIDMLEQALKAIGREDILRKCKIAQNQIGISLPENNDVYNEYETSSTIQRLHEHEETKYSGEEKEVGESESDDENQKRTVAERREKIVKRLSIERQIPASAQKKEIAQEITEIKRKSLIEDKKAMHEEEIMLQMPTDNIIKSMVPEHMLKLKLNKLDTTEVSKIDFDNELILKFKTTKERTGTGEQSDDNNETIDNEKKISTNLLIQKSDSNTSVQYSEKKNGVQLEELKKNEIEITDIEMRTIEQREPLKTTVSSQVFISKDDSGSDFNNLLEESLQTSAAKVIFEKDDMDNLMSYEKTKDNVGTFEEEKDGTCSNASEQQQQHQIDIKTITTNDLTQLHRTKDKYTPTSFQNIKTSSEEDSKHAPNKKHEITEKQTQDSRAFIGKDSKHGLNERDEITESNIQESIDISVKESLQSSYDEHETTQATLTDIKPCIDIEKPPSNKNEENAPNIEDVKDKENIPIGFCEESHISDVAEIQNTIQVNEDTEHDLSQRKEEARSINKDNLPRAIPRTCLFTTEDAISGISETVTNTYKSDSRECKKEVPIPKPRQQQKYDPYKIEVITKSSVNSSCETIDLGSENAIAKESVIFTQDSDKIMASVNELSNLQSSERSNITLRMKMNEEIEPYSAEPIKVDKLKDINVISTNEQTHTIFGNCIEETARFISFEKNFNNSSQVNPSLEPLEGTQNQQVDIHMKETYFNTYSDINSENNTDNKINDIQITKVNEHNDNELQTSFYIGESSSNVIQKTKPLQQIADEDSSCNQVSLKNESSPVSGSVSIQDSKVIRQGSETRNDLLEIETERISNQNKSEETNSELQPKINLKAPASQSIAIHKFENKIDLKSVKLDLLLDKSETELPEKSNLMNTSNKDIISRNAIILDEFLVERTLEEVKLSLDAAKDELIQVVKDGRTIKQSPSEFEFKNIPHVGDTSGHFSYQEEEKFESTGEPSVVLNDLCSSHYNEGTRILPVAENSSSDISTKSMDLNKQMGAKPQSPVNKRWSLHDIDNSSSSDSYYKSGSRPCSSDFDTVHTGQTSSEYQTAQEASICQQSTEYVSAISTFESSKLISSHESMKSFSSETSGNLGSIDTSDISETLVASVGDQDIDIELENEDLRMLESDLEMQPHDGTSSKSVASDSPQSCMKRSQEMIFTEQEINSTTQAIQKENDKEKTAMPSDEVDFVPVSSVSAVNITVNTFEGTQQYSDTQALILSSDMDTFLNDINQTSIQKQKQIEEHQSNRNLPADEVKYTESTSLIHDILDDDTETSSSDEIDKNSTICKISTEECKGSGSESDHDPYQSEYSRAFKSPTVKKKKKEKKHNECQSPEKNLSPLNLIIEDSVTEEMELQLSAEEKQHKSQNMQDYSNIPNITVTEEAIKYEEESGCDSLDSSLYKVRTQNELDKVEGAVIKLKSETSFSTPDNQFNELVQKQYKEKLAELNKPNEFESRAPDSPDSFEMVDQPDVTDEFIIIEEVAKEASEFDQEGQSIKISSNKILQKYDEEVEHILIKSAPAATNLGSQILRDDLNFDFEESPPLNQGNTEMESNDSAINKKWVEMQLSDHAAQLRYPYELERGVLEDIKEEDAEFDVGSSRISSFKNSFSSTPDYDVLAGKRYFSRNEHDNMSMNSLQEFESLEQAISLENRKICHSSTDSSSGSFTRRFIVRNTCGDEISLSSLKEFEGLENACIEAHLIEIKAKEEAALLLSRSDESNASGVEHKISPSSIKISEVMEPKTLLFEEKESSSMKISTDSLEEDSSSISGSGLKPEGYKEQTTTLGHSKTKSGDLGLNKSQSNSCVEINESESTFDSLKISSMEETLKKTKIASINSENASMIPKDMSNDSLNICMEYSSSATTDATCYNEGDSIMSGSVTSCGSSTLVEDSIIPVTSQSLTQSSYGHINIPEELSTKDESIGIINQRT